MVRGIAKRKKTYVEVEAVHTCEGFVKPLRVRWRDGRSWEVDSVLDHIQAHALKVGGVGIRYRVVICGIEKILWYEHPRWFVEEIIPESVCDEFSYGNAFGIPRGK